jgi:FixJ family two-component response regulator
MGGRARRFGRAISLYAAGRRVSNQAKVYVVDDDAAVRNGLSAMFDAAGLAAEVYDSAAAFLAAHRAEWMGCLVLDLNMPHMSGLELQTELNRRGSTLPIIFLTGHGDIPLTVNAIKAGAVDFLTKPVNGALLLTRVRAALAQSMQVSEGLAGLTEREREVMVRVAAGYASKEIARELDISHRTVEIHRARVMQKMKSRSVLELANIVRSLGLVLPSSPSKRR